MAKNRIVKNQNPDLLYKRIKSMYMNKYYNMFMNMVKWHGLTTEEQWYVMRKFWSLGTIAAFRIKNTDMIGYAPYTEFSWNMYDFPSEVTLINERGVPFIPNTTQVVDKDVVLGWAQFNKKPVKEIVEYYIDRMTQVDMVVNTNIELHKMPYLIGVDPSDIDKMNDVVNRILNNELVVFTDLEAVNLLKSVQTAPSYIIDKLHAYRIQLENELLSYFGVDNSGNSEKATTMLLDEINSNNEIINLSQDQFKTCFDNFCKRIKEVFGKDVSAELKLKPAEESLESRNRSDAEKESGFVRQGENKDE